jgi:hypothetical protein
MSSTTTTTPGTPASIDPAPRRRQLLIGAVVLVLVAAAAVIWLLNSSGNDKVPYTDTRSSGTLTLCGADGKPVTSGSTGRAPFAARAVGATAVHGPAAAAGRSATLYAYQPRPGTGSQEWSGQQLTAASTYTNAKHPMAAATTKDIPLQDFLTAFPPQWNGLVQLRLYLTAPQVGVGDTYDTVNVKVDGSSWKVVGNAGTASCTAGSATSAETTAQKPS